MILSSSYIVIDDFLDEEILTTLIMYSEKLHFRDLSSTTAIRGRRSKRLNSIEPITSSKIIKKFQSLDVFSAVNHFDLYLHKVYVGHFEKGYDIKTMAWHDDIGYNCAGVVYLNKTPESNSGTLLNIEGEVIGIENKFNRLAFYNSSILHRVENAFYSEARPRLTLTIFAK